MNVYVLPHRHHWEVRSTHSTSQGRVRYQRCACGEWQVTLAREADPSDLNDLNDLNDMATPVVRVPAERSP